MNKELEFCELITVWSGLLALDVLTLVFRL